MKINAAILLSLLVIPLTIVGGVPIKTNVPIYVPANLPVSGTVCIPSQLAIGLKAKLYVDKAFVEEGEVNESGCYKVTIKPLSPGKHNLHAEIYKGGLKVADIEAEVIAIKGMIIVRPNPLTVMKRGEKKEVSLYLENKSPINMSNVRAKIEAPFPIFAYHMMRARNFVVSGSLGDILVNETKEVRLILAVPKEFRPGSYNLKINLTYRVAGSEYSVPLETSIIVSNESVQREEASKELSESIALMRKSYVPSWLIVLLVMISIFVVAAVVYLVSRSQ